MQERNVHNFTKYVFSLIFFFSFTLNLILFSFLKKSHFPSLNCKSFYCFFFVCSFVNIKSCKSNFICMNVWFRANKYTLYINLQSLKNYYFGFILSNVNIIVIIVLPSFVYERLAIFRVFQYQLTIAEIRTACDMFNKVKRHCVKGRPIHFIW